MNTKKKHIGQSVIELAMVLPVAFFLIIGFLDLGRVVFYYSSLTNAVREATRFAIVSKDDITAAFNNPSDNSLQDKVLEYALGLTGIPDSLTKDDISVTVNKVDDKFSTVSIEVMYSFKPITPGIKALFGSPDGIDFTVRSEMYVTPASK